MTFWVACLTPIINRISSGEGKQISVVMLFDQMLNGQTEEGDAEKVIYFPDYSF